MITIDPEYMPWPLEHSKGGSSGKHFTTEDLHGLFTSAFRNDYLSLTALMNTIEFVTEVDKFNLIFNQISNEHKYMTFISQRRPKYIHPRESIQWSDKTRLNIYVTFRDDAVCLNINKNRNLKPSNYEQGCKFYIFDYDQYHCTTLFKLLARFIAEEKWEQIYYDYTEWFSYKYSEPNNTNTTRTFLERYFRKAKK